VRVTPRARLVALAIAVGVVLADSSIVILALPDILARYHVAIRTVTLVLVSFNLVLAVCAVPASLVARRSPRRSGIVGLIGFAAASVACGAAPSFAALVAARGVQAAFGALVIAATLEVLVAEGGRSGQHAWTLAGIAGAAIGPAAGGLLTQTLGWQSIFYAQAPFVLAALPAFGVLDAHPPAPAGARMRPTIALALVSAALTAALFLLVILMIEGWGLRPAAAAIAVTVMPAGAILATRLRVAPLPARAATGCVLCAGGLAALGLLPGANVAWTILPQLLIGLGLGFAFGALTELALADGASGIAGGVTIAARHAGVVFALVVLTPIFTADLNTNTNAALQAGAAVLLDSRVAVGDKIGLARDILTDVQAAHGRLPDIAPAFASRPATPTLAAVHSQLQSQLDRAATHAFSRSFLAASVFALAALIPISMIRRRQEA
jgi:MFS family permease